MATIHALAALHRALASAIEARKAVGESANYGRDGFQLTVAVDDAKVDFALACRARIQEAAAEYDQQAARMVELENRNAALQLQVDTWRETEATTTAIGEEQCAKLQAEVARLREALEPFARMGSLVEHAIEIPALTYGEYEATYEDLKRAADVLRVEPG